MLERLRNREVPFPYGEVRRIGLFEKYVLAVIMQGQHHKYGDFPQKLEVGGIESYFNWLGQLTIADPQQAERGTAVHCDVRRERIRYIYPVNPNVGTGESVKPVYSTKPRRFLPAVNVHTHNTASIFSPKDLKMFGSHTYIAYAVVTPVENWLFIKTQQTTNETILQETSSSLYSERTYLEETAAKRLFGEKIGDLYHYDFYFRHTIENAERTLYPRSSFESYYGSVEQALLFAKRNKLALYYSCKDGIYTLASEEKLRGEAARFSEVLKNSDWVRNHLLHSED